jgi:cytochrome c peroxidase
MSSLRKMIIGVAALAAVAWAPLARAEDHRQYADAKPEECAELRFAAADGAELVRAFKTPSLRNVAERAPYMHAGQVATLADVVAHYSAAPRAPFGRSELRPLRLTRAEQLQLVAFLRTLSAPLAAPAGFLDAPPAPR